MVPHPLRRRPVDAAARPASSRPSRRRTASSPPSRRRAAVLVPLAASLLLLAACSDGGTDGTDGLPAAGGGAAVPDGAAGRLDRGGVVRPLTDGLLIDYGPSGAHYNIDIGLADSSYRVASVLQPDFVFGGLTSVLVYPADDASVEFDAALYSPGTDGFRDGTFEFANVEETALEDAPAALVGRAVFVNAVLYPDADGDGESDEDGIAVTGGQLAIRTTAAGFALSLDVTLVDGTRLTGSYSGSALFVDETE